MSYIFRDSRSSREYKRNSNLCCGPIYNLIQNSFVSFFFGLPITQRNFSIIAPKIPATTSIQKEMYK